MPNDPIPKPGMPSAANQRVVSGPTCATLAGRAAGAKCDQLSLLVNSRNPIITVESSEEQRFLGLLERVAEQLSVPLYVWSVTTGLCRPGGAVLYNSDQPEQALTNIGTIHGDGIFY